MKYFKTNNLQKDETIFLFEQYHKDLNNNITPENSLARTTLILAYDRMIKYVLIKLLKKEYNEDLLSLGKIGLVKSIDYFNMDREVDFCNWTITIIKNEILHYLIKYNKEQKYQVVSLDDKDKEDEESLSLYEQLGEEDQFYLDFENKEVFKTVYPLFKYLKPSEQYILFYQSNFFNTNNKDIIEIFNFSHTNFYNRFREIKNKLKILLTPIEELSKTEKSLYSFYKNTTYKVMTYEDYIDYKYQAFEQPLKIIDMVKYFKHLTLNEKKEIIRSNYSKILKNYFKYLTVIEQKIIIDYCGIFSNNVNCSYADLEKKYNLTTSNVVDNIQSAFKKLLLFLRYEKTGDIGKFDVYLKSLKEYPILNQTSEEDFNY